MIAVIVVQIVTIPTDRWRSIDRDTVTAPFRLGSAIVLGRFSLIKNLLGRTEMRTHERKDRKSLRTVWDISRDDWAIVVTCSLRTATDRFMENYSIDYCYWHHYSQRFTITSCMISKIRRSRLLEIVKEDFSLGTCRLWIKITLTVTNNGHLQGYSLDFYKLPI